MTQLTINIEDKTIVPHLRKILNAIEGVSIVKEKYQKKTSIDEALEDVRLGNVTKFNSVEDFFKNLGI